MSHTTNEDIKDSVDTLQREVDVNPTNADLLAEIHAGKRALENHTADDHKIATAHQKSLDALHKWKEELPDMIRAIFAEELKNFFKVTGVNTKTVIVTGGLIVGSLVVIFGGVKSLLAWIGFVSIR
jgi:hypothetical protein